MEATVGLTLVEITGKSAARAVLAAREAPARARENFMADRKLENECREWMIDR